MKIYLAGASSERDICRTYRDRLIAAGHTITKDWIADVDAAVAAGKTDRDFNAEAREAFAAADCEGVESADVFWLLIPANPKASIGCWVELGVALTHPKPRTIISGDVGASIFCDLAHQLFTDHETAFSSLVYSDGAA